MTEITNSEKDQPTRIKQWFSQDLDNTHTQTMMDDKIVCMFSESFVMLLFYTAWIMRAPSNCTVVPYSLI